MKLQAASRKEVKRIVVGVIVCNIAMIAGLFLLSQFGIGTFSLPKILIGALCGSVIAVVNFIILCLTIQSAIEIENKRKMKRRFQTSYNIRLLVQAVWIVGCFFLRDKVHFVAAAAPVFYPNVWLVFLQVTGRLNTGNTTPVPAQEPASEDTPQE
ncbi:MAG: ATP synthase subunit I [Oscillospiraceae bacterium]|nr:ATP synthase subunit I [Oscillospiraceae bacterium]